MQRFRPRLFLGCLASLALAAVHCRPATGPGVIVESLGKGGAGEAAGLHAGDLLVAWVRSASGANRAGQGALASPFDVIDLEVEQAPRGAVVVTVRRDGHDRVFRLPPGAWKLTTVSAAGRAGHHTATALLDQGKHVEAAAEWARAADELVTRGAPVDACWLRILAARALAGRKHWDAAHATLAAAREAARRAMDARAEAVAWEEDADVQRAEGAVAKADEGYALALRLRERGAPASLAAAAILQKRARLAAGSRRDFDTAFQYTTTALAQRQALAPGSLAVANSLTTMGNIAFRRGDAEQAEDFYRRALAIQETFAPDGADALVSAENIGSTLLERGDTVGAEQYVRRALALAERWVPDSADHAAALGTLGNIHFERGDLDRAEDFYRRALDIVERLSPLSHPVAGYINNLANVALRRGDLARAGQLHRQALVMREKLAPGTLDVAVSLQNLGAVARQRGEFASAEALFRRALAIERTVAPGSLEEAETHFEAGELALGRGDSRASLEEHQEALRLRSQRAPGGIVEAESLFALGAVHRRWGRPVEAAAAWERGLEVLEGVRGRLRGSDGGGFGAKYAGFYHDLMELRVGQGRTADAFALLERSRARGLVALLAERDLVFADVPRDLERERRKADGEYDRTLAELGELEAADSVRARELGLKLAELRDGRAQATQRLRAAAPQLAALRYPEPLDIGAAAAALPPGALLLAYSVGQEGTLLFVVPSRAGATPTVFKLPLGGDALRARITAFRGLIERGRQDAHLEDALLAQGARLWTDLLGPAESSVRRATRLVIVPDGPLHTLPFAALVTDRSVPLFLAERLPLQTVLSATLYDQLRKLARPSRGGPVLVAFGDAPRSASDAAAALGALPFTRDEVERIARVYDPQARRLLGADATEERAKQLGRGPRYIHFASHAVLDRRVPLDSGLLLGSVSRTGAQGENGLLQAWEIFERIRIDADLVTLSACDTGLGRELAGEGLVGLSRAFQYAGARAVLASLWAVADDSTPTLMEAFYRALKEGKPKDEALQQAQVQLIRAGSHPFHWAAFQISGDGN